MSHHDHPHDHSHDPVEMTFAQKIVKLLEHWVKHNDDHATSYRGWADQAKLNHLDEVAAIIEQAAEMNLAINEKFEKAKALLKEKG